MPNAHHSAHKGVNIFKQDTEGGFSIDGENTECSASHYMIIGNRN